MMMDKKFFLKNKWKILLFVFVFIWLCSSIYSAFKFVPDGINVAGEVYNISDEDIDFLFDLTYFNNSSMVYEQEIFDNVFNIVDNAERFIVIDMFLFNTDYSKKRFINITSILKEKLIMKKKSNPEIQIVFITDEINNFYGSYVSDEIRELQENGINVVITDLTKLRDVNFIYAGFWRAYIQWFGSYGNGFINHPLGRDDTKITIRSVLKLLNTKANHRKLMIADSGNEIVSFISSANPHEASSLHSNVALLIYKSVWRDFLEAEISVARFSGFEINNLDLSFVNDSSEGDIQLQFLTEEEIRKNLLSEINSMKEGEELDIAMFYLSDRKIINCILDASERGVIVNLILDPNKDAFARDKNGIPNRPVANELFEKSDGRINIKWYNTNGEQFHTKMIIIKKKDKIIVFLGSANLTKRNIGNFNLEANVKVVSPYETNFSNEVSFYFERIWNNKDGEYSLEFDAFREESYGKYLLYRFQEASGFSSF